MTASVLIVDDDHASAKLVGVLLEVEGCRTVQVANAEDALLALASFRPDIIVLDLVLPLMSGLLFVQQLRADPATKHIPVVAVTAFNGYEAERVALAAGCTAFVRKPIDAETFPQLVFSHLGGSK